MTDGPPLLAGTAGAAFAAFAGQVVLVVAAGQTSEEAIDASLRRRGEREKACFVLNRGHSPATSLVAAFCKCVSVEAFVAIPP